jgi:hypothetical protein
MERICDLLDGKWLKVYILVLAKKQNL